MMSEVDINLIVHKRKFLRGQITKNYNEIETLKNLNPLEKVAKSSKFKSMYEEIKAFDVKVQQILCSENKNDELEVEFEQSADYLDKLLVCIAAVEKISNSNRASDSNISNANSVESARSLLKSPTAPLPKFSGSVNEDLNRFLKSFEETINRYNYPEYDKFILLKQQLSSRALVIVESLEIDKQSYEHAKTLLTSAFASPEVLKYNTIKRISESKLSDNDDPFTMIMMIKFLKLRR